MTTPERETKLEVEQPSLFQGRDRERYRRAVAACSDEDRAACVELVRWARAERRDQP